MKISYLMLASAALLATACNAEKGATSSDKGPEVTAKAVPAPNNGDWSTVVSKTAEGGFVMGNPNAKVKLVEYGSLTCPHCREFDETGSEPLINTYVKSGQVSYEFRNYVRDAFDLAATLIARCNGPKGFFPLARSLYKDQMNWVGKVQAVPREQLEGLTNLPTGQIPPTAAKFAGLQQWAVARGIPEAKSAQCLSNETDINRLVQQTSAVTDQFPDFPGTPTFVINGKMAEKTATWKDLEPKLREALR